MSAPRLLASSVCVACRRTLLRQHQRQFSTSRTQLAAAFQSYSLPSQPPPAPRNASVPDPSITHNIQSPKLPQVHETRPPKEPQAPLDPARASLSPSVSIPEREAQKSKSDFAAPTQSPLSSTSSPHSTPSAPAPTPKPAARPRSKLRAPRKAAMKLTPAAVDHLRALLDQPDPRLIKVGVRNRGCSGLAYHLEFVEKPGAFDETVEQDGVQVLIDSKALFSIIGSEMDWVEDKLSQRFVFRNPNISKSILLEILREKKRGQDANDVSQRNNAGVESRSWYSVVKDGSGNENRDGGWLLERQPKGGFSSRQFHQTGAEWILAG
ncbi:hypothetical protein QBC35DRAFT_504608 [Podospora australis]|uniref:Core domain-containing protein n=1 Tax=Podospora australis TaxID=1536484 RepID=A0AAN7ADZ5_9PEZI|nr:hypothetical protein QBC35DRAFT_504608 [Podospora australis]